MMKILLVIDQFFDANNGMTISARKFALRLSQHGNEVRVVSTGKEGDTEYLMRKQYIPIFDKLVSQQGMTFAKADRPVIQRAVEWADVVHFLVPFVLSHEALKIAKKLNVPYTAAFHVQPENVTSSVYLSKVKLINDLIYRWFDHYLYKFCDHIHCPSKLIASELVKHGYKSKLYIISNGIDDDFVYIKKDKREPDEFVIITIGRYSIEKRQDLIIDAVGKSKYKDNIHLILAGQGPRGEKLKKRAIKRSVNATFKFYTKSELIDELARADLYVHAADAEIEAMSCMEAFACGLVPVISDSPKSATPQFALDKRSLFTAGSVDALAQRIDYWIEHTDERKLMEKRYSTLAESYRLDECVRRIEQMFDEAIRDNKRGIDE